MGREQDAWLDRSSRGDIITWLNGEKRAALEASGNLSFSREHHIPLAPNLFSVLQKMDAMRKELNETCKFDSQHTQVSTSSTSLIFLKKAQLACYPGNGTHYVKHLDAFVGGSSRRITCLYYLNFDWKSSDGGCLRIHKDGTTKDVEPIGGNST